ncbi:Quinone oxidoreductase [uncultured Rubrobacteraceae bacterium]|uniref:Quinone oxidoreductase n=1 Tax=uncultured Rubrobacteraceae bacterium TaxID=349277 RepID=A0A6J4Q6B8_9ACTN|nr:Quinone oxidoreductase [uncultured Rubrobacteraceae bacterium]
MATSPSSIALDERDHGKILHADVGSFMLEQSADYRRPRANQRPATEDGEKWMKAIRIHEPGGPEVLRLENIETPEPDEGQVLIKIELAGVNYADTGMRRGMRFGPHQAQMPLTPGFEAAGTVAVLGEGVEAPPEGTRVAAVLESGGYAEYAVADDDMVVEVPEEVDFHTASAALLVQGITVYGVLHDAARL